MKNKRILSNEASFLREKVAGDEKKFQFAQKVMQGSIDGYFGDDPVQKVLFEIALKLKVSGTTDLQSYLDSMSFNKEQLQFIEERLKADLETIFIAMYANLRGEKLRKKLEKIMTIPEMVLRSGGLKTDNKLFALIANHIHALLQNGFSLEEVQEIFKNTQKKISPKPSIKDQLDLIDEIFSRKWL